MDEDTTEKGPKGSVLARALQFCRDEPVSVGLLLAFTLAGAAGAFLIPLGDMSVARRVAGGAVAGFYFGLFPLGFRLFR